MVRYTGLVVDSLKEMNLTWSFLCCAMLPHTDSLLIHTDSVCLPIAVQVFCFFKCLSYFLHQTARWHYALCWPDCALVALITCFCFVFFFF